MKNIKKVLNTKTLNVAEGLGSSVGVNVKESVELKKSSLEVCGPVKKGVEEKTAVIFVHGLFMHPVVMKFLESKLKKSNFNTYQFSYKSRHYNEGTLDKLLTMVKELKEKKCCFVGHSMGGLVLKNFLIKNRMFLKEKFEDLKFITLGTPHKSSKLAKFIGKSKLKVVLGSSGESGLIKEVPQWSVKEFKFGCICGTKALGLLGVLRGKKSDGIVFFEESKDESADDILAMKVSHTTMLYSKKVAHQIEYFAKHGEFDKANA